MHKQKEVYFLFAFLIILIIGFFLGRFFTLSACYEQKSFNAEYMEECSDDRDTYLNLCGDLDRLEADSALQECINACYP